MSLQLMNTSKLSRQTELQEEETWILDLRLTGNKTKTKVCLLLSFPKTSRPIMKSHLVLLLSLVLSPGILLRRTMLRINTAAEESPAEFIVFTSFKHSGISKDLIKWADWWKTDVGTKRKRFLIDTSLWLLFKEKKKKIRLWTFPDTLLVACL